MKCSNCTTELWGRPAVCPVCGTPTGLNRRTSRQTPPPWSTSPAAPPPAPPPTRSAPLAQPFFNASDLLEPDALAAVPQAPGNIGIFSTGPLQDREPADEAPPGMLNAADLFDPEVLADLTGGREEGRSSQGREEEAQEDDFPAFLREGPRDDYQDSRGNYRQGPRPSNGPISAPRAATGSIAPPLFSLSALPTAEPQPFEPPLPPPPPFPLREPALPGPPMLPPDEQDWQQPPRGYRGSSGPLPMGAPLSRPPGPPPGIYPPGAYPTMPPPPASKGRRPQAPARGRRFFGILGGLMSLVLVLAIIGIALLFGAAKLFQLQSLIIKPTQAPPGPLPTVAPKAGYTIFPDKTIGFSLQFADSWNSATDHDAGDSDYKGDLFWAGPNTGFEVGTAPVYANWSPSQIDDYVLSHPFPLANVSPPQIFVPTSPTIRIANQDWTAEDANMTASGVNLRVACLSIIHNGQGYVIFYYAPQEVFSSNYSEYFEPMLLSFRFLND